jgi:hypothetical protein
MQGDIREVLAIVVAATSPAGLATKAIHELAGHLPTPDAPGICPTCADRFWPCRSFDRAAHRLHTIRLRLSDWIPLDLHPRLWQQPAQPSRKSHESPTIPPDKGGDRG